MSGRRHRLEDYGVLHHETAVENALKVIRLVVEDFLMDSQLELIADDGEVGMLPCYKSFRDGGKIEFCHCYRL